MARIPYELLCGVVLNLIDMSIYSDGITLTPVNNPIVGDPFEIKCNTGVNVINTVAITTPDSTIIGSCNPAIHPFPASCANDASYKATLDEATHTLTVNTTSLPSTVGGVWTCTHNFATDIYNLTLIGIRGLRSYLSPVLSPQDITSETPVNLSATYECIDTPVHFEWFAVDNSSQMTPLDVTNLVEVNESLCTAYLGFDAYTQTYSSSSVKGLNGRYRIGVEAHYSGEVTALQSIQYFNTYFIFAPSTSSTTPGSRGTNTPTEKDCKAIGILAVCGVIAYSIVTVMVALRIFIRSTGKKRGKCFLTFCQFIEDNFFDCCGNKNSKKNWLLGFTYLVVFGVIMEVVVLTTVYYRRSKFQVGLVIGVGFVIVLVLSGLCLLVVWMSKKSFKNEKSKCEEKPENSTSMITEKVTT